MKPHLRSWLQRHARHLLLLVPLPLVLAGIYFLLSGRGILFGPPLFQVQIDACRIPGSSAVVRVYEGNFGATTAYSYRLTYQKSFFSPERYFFGSYGLPMVGSVECSHDHISLDTSGGVISISIAELEGELLDHPMYFEWDRREYSDSSARPLPNISRICGAICGTKLLLLALVVTLLLRRAQRRQGGAAAHNTAPRP